MIAGIAAAVACVVVGGLPYGLVAAVVVGPGAALAVTQLAARASATVADDALALALDLAAAALRAGRTLPDALEAVAPISPASGPTFDRVSGLLRLGALPVDAWSTVAPDSDLVPVARAAVRSETSGVRLATALERAAGRIRAELRTRGEQRAARAGVLVLAPLGLCFLPAFVCLGVVPVVVGIARSGHTSIP